MKHFKKRVKKIYKGLKKRFKKITRSKWGRIALGAALIYFAAPLAISAFSGAGAAAGGAALGGAGATSGMAGIVAGGAQAGAAAGAAMTGATAGTFAAGSSGLWASAGAALKGAASFAASNPVLTKAALGAVSSATTPDEIDIAREDEKRRNRDIARMNENLQVGDINVGFGQQPGINDQDQQSETYTRPQGLINKSRPSRIIIPKIDYRQGGLIRRQNGAY